ncbi:MAG: PKD domain-containing protein [Bacteroidia bacterium]
MKTSIKFLSVVFFALVIFSCSKSSDTMVMKDPMACCSMPSTGTVGQSISFSSSCSTDAGNYKWDFGDSTTSTNANPTHTYLKARIYTVKLTATSSDGMKSNDASKSITIN